MTNEVVQGKYSNIKYYHDTYIYIYIYIERERESDFDFPFFIWLFVNLI